MALDGALLRHLRIELEEKLLGARVDKIYQPSREELILALRTREASFRLLVSARANSARIHLTEIPLENPKEPPMFCMLLRKRLTGARLTALRQPGLERVLHLDFESIDELGDRVILTLSAEIMGKYSNIILTGQDGRIIDAIKRVDSEMSSQRLVLPGLSYQPPPAQNKLDVLETSPAKLSAALKTLPGDMELSKALLSLLFGVSPIVCRELAFSAGRGAPLTAKTLTEEQSFRVGFFYGKLRETVENITGTPHFAVDAQKKPLDFTFTDIHQYGSSAIIYKGDSFSKMLDDFYRERDQRERMRVKEQDLLRNLSTISERLSRKITAQRGELLQSAKRGELKVCGDLLSANMYSIEKGLTSVKLPNFYEEGEPLKEIRLNPALSASQNAQKYYKDYRKAKTAETVLSQQIELAQKEMEYLESVLDSLSRAESDRDLEEIREELREQGYLKTPRDKRQKAVSLGEPREYKVSDGFTVLVGKNNRQNDRLTFKIANKNDIWLHTKNIPGAHTLLLTGGRSPTEGAIADAAKLAAFHSKARNSSQVAVDYTQVRNVSKPQGAKPGMVIYVKYKTVFVTPDRELGEEK